MNHCVPGFEMDENRPFPAPSDSIIPQKSAMAGEDLMELLWHNGGVVLHNQAHRVDNSCSKSGGASPPRGIRASASSHQRETEDQLFLREDELASWLHYPLNDDGVFCTDLMYQAPRVTSNAELPQRRATCASEKRPPAPAVMVQDLAQAPPVQPQAQRPPVPPVGRTEAKSRVQSFGPFLMPNRCRVDPSDSGPSTSKAVAKESTVVDSCETPTAVHLCPKASEPISTYLPSSNNTASQTITGTVTAGSSFTATGTSRDVTTYDVTAISSPEDSSTSPEPSQKPPTEDRKRKGREAVDAACHSEDSKQARGSNAKRSRAAEVHNLSERRRRDRINEKMRALQELIPRCNKSDKASMLDEAIEYLKSLQLQVQMMSMGCGMVPMMFPGVQPYMPHVGMSMGMGMNMGGMGMGMELGANQPMMPFPRILSGSSLHPSAAAAHLGSRFPMPTYPLPQVPPELARTQGTTQQNASTHRTENSSQPWNPGHKESN